MTAQPQAKPTHLKDGPLASTARDLDVAKADLEEVGFCVLEGLLPPQDVERLHERVMRQTAAEEARGLHDQAQGKATSQYVYMLINKGAIFRELVEHPVILELVEHVLGPDFLLSASDAVICKPGGGVMPLHTDQWWMPHPVPRIGPQLRVGSIRRFTHREEVSDDPARPISAAAVANVMWTVSDFTEENGATRLVPGSHLSGEQPDPSVPHKVASIAGTGPAGTAIVFDGRIWHATGSNTSDQPRAGIITAYCGPQFRPMENYTLGARREVLETASPTLLRLLGFKSWDGYGKLDDPGVDFVTRDMTPVGEL